jgi:hypothetical protein
MLSISNNVRFRFRDSDHDSQVVVSGTDYRKMVKRIVKTTGKDRATAINFLHASFYNEIKRVYGVPSNLTVVIEE